MRSFRKIISLFFFLLIITTAGIFYLNTIFFPFQAKDIITSKAKTLLKRDVSIRQINFHFTKGLVLKNIRIAEKENSALAFFTADEITLSVPLPNFLKTGHLFIPSITIQKPQIHLNRITNNLWNFSDLLTSQKPDAKSASPFQKSPFSLGAINIEGGEILLADQNACTTIGALNTKIQFTLLNNINFETNFTVPADQTIFSAKGNFALATKELVASIKTKNLNPPHFIDLIGVPLYVVFDQWLITQAQMTLQAKPGEFTLTGSITSPVNVLTKTNVPVRVHGTLLSKNFLFHKKGRDFNLNGNFIAPKTTIAIDTKRTLLGNFSGNDIHIQKIADQLTITGNLISQNTQITLAEQQLTSDIEFEKAAFKKQNSEISFSTESKISNAIFTDEIWDITSNLSIAELHVKKTGQTLSIILPHFSTKDLSGLFMNKKIAGQIDGQNIQINLDDAVLKAHGHFTTQNLTIAVSKTIGFSGNPTIDLLFNRDPNNKLSYNGSITFADDHLQGIAPTFPVDNLKGKLTFNADSASSENLTFNLGQTAITLAGSINNFASPYFKTNVAGNDFTVSLLGKSTKNLISLSSLKGKLHHTSFDLQGDFKLNNGLPDADLTGTIALDLADLALFPSMTEKLKALSPTGIITFQGHYLLPALSWPKLSLAVTAASSQILLYGYSFQNLSANLLTLDNASQNIKLTTTIYDGQFKANTTFALTQANIPIEISADLFGLNLEKFKNTYPNLKEKDFAGLLSANIKLNGELLDNKTLQGSGAALVSDGRLLELEMLKGIWKILFTNFIADDYQKIAFTQAKATFKIANQKIVTNDLTLKSVPADISAQGWVDFAKHINFNVIAHVRQAPLVTTQAVKAVPTTVLSQFAKNAVGIKLTGTLSEPKIKYEVLPFKILEKTTDSIFQGIQGMLEDVLDQ